MSNKPPWALDATSNPTHIKNILQRFELVRVEGTRVYTATVPRDIEVFDRGVEAVGNKLYIWGIGPEDVGQMRATTTYTFTKVSLGDQVPKHAVLCAVVPGQHVTELVFYLEKIAHPDAYDPPDCPSLRPCGTGCP